MHKSFHNKFFFYAVVLCLPYIHNIRIGKVFTYFVLYTLRMNHVRVRLAPFNTYNNTSYNKLYVASYVHLS